MSVEEALRDASLRSGVEAMMPAIDGAYAVVLQCASAILRATDPKKLSQGQVKWTEPHIAPRRRLEGILGESLVSSGGIGRWQEQLVEMETFETTNLRAELTTRERISNYGKLLVERDRFATWLRNQVAAAVTADRPSDQTNIGL